MQFITNRISTNSNSKTFADIVAEMTQKKEPQVKVASSVSVTKTAEADEAPSSGQPEAEAKLVNRPERDDVPASGSKEKCEEADSSGQPEAEAKLVNDPKVETDTPVKKASSDEDDDKDTDDADKADDTNKADDTDDTDDTDDGGLTEGQKKLPEALQKAIKNKKASNAKWVKIANLDGKSKEWLKKYYSNVWPTEFVDALLADK